METSNSNRRTGEWLGQLRREFVRVASRRVETSDVEDVVQEALRVIAEKGIDRGAEPVEGVPPLAWCFQVLRNTIGNYYQRRRTRQHWVDDGAHPDDTGIAPGATVMESLSSRRTLSIIEDALEEMTRNDPTCAGYLTRLADGTRAGDLAEEESVERHAFYRRLYRCRQKLRELLGARGVVI